MVKKMFNEILRPDHESRNSRRNFIVDGIGTDSKADHNTRAVLNSRCSSDWDKKFN